MKDNNQLIWHDMLWVNEEITNELWVSPQASWLRCFPSPYIVYCCRNKLCHHIFPPIPTDLDKQYTNAFKPKINASEKKWRKPGTGVSVWYFNEVVFLFWFPSAGLTVKRALGALPFSVSAPCPCLVWMYVLFIEFSTEWFRTELLTTAISVLETLCYGRCV